MSLFTAEELCLELYFQIDADFNMEGTGADTFPVTSGLPRQLIVEISP